MRLLLAEGPDTGLTVTQVNPLMFVPGEIHPSGLDAWEREDYFDLLPADEFFSVMDYIDTWIEEAEAESDEAEEMSEGMAARGRGRARREARRAERAARKRERMEARLYRKNLRLEKRAERKGGKAAGRAAILEAKATYGAEYGEFDPTTGELIVSGIREIAPEAAGIISALKGMPPGGFPGMPISPITDQFGRPVGPPPPRILGMHPALAIGIGVVVLGGITYFATRKTAA